MLANIVRLTKLLTLQNPVRGIVLGYGSVLIKEGCTNRAAKYSTMPQCNVSDCDIARQMSGLMPSGRMTSLCQNASCADVITSMCCIPLTGWPSNSIKWRCRTLYPVFAIRRMALFAAMKFSHFRQTRSIPVNCFPNAPASGTQSL